MLKQLVITIAFFSFISVAALAQDKPETEKKEKQECTKCYCANKEMHSEMKMGDSKEMHKHMDHKKSDSDMHGMNHEINSGSMDHDSMVREGEIDLKAIDKNGDGKVYQDQMCWNVISDKEGECPQCGMILKEVSLEKATQNLIKNDFKVK